MLCNRCLLATTQLDDSSSKGVRPMPWTLKLQGGPPRVWRHLEAAWKHLETSWGHLWGYLGDRRLQKVTCTATRQNGVAVRGLFFQKSSGFLTDVSRTVGPNGGQWPQLGSIWPRLLVWLPGCLASQSASVHEKLTRFSTEYQKRPLWYWRAWDRLLVSIL